MNFEFNFFLVAKLILSTEFLFFALKFKLQSLRFLLDLIHLRVQFLDRGVIGFEVEIRNILHFIVIFRENILDFIFYVLHFVLQVFIKLLILGQILRVLILIVDHFENFLLDLV